MTPMQPALSQADMVDGWKFAVVSVKFELFTQAMMPKMVESTPGARVWLTQFVYTSDPVKLMFVKVALDMFMQAICPTVKTVVPPYVFVPAITVFCRVTTELLAIPMKLPVCT